MEVAAFNVDGVHLLVADFDAPRVAVAVEVAGHGEARIGFRCANKLQDDNMTDEGFAAPVLRYEGEQPVLYFVPLARARRQMSDRDFEAGFIGQFLKLDLPQTDPGRRTPGPISLPACLSSAMPRLIVLRAIPVAAATALTPPRPSDKASLATNKRRLRSSRKPSNLRNRCRKSPVFMTNTVDGFADSFRAFFDSFISRQALTCG